MKVLILQPPKYFWPYISSDDNFLVPQALPCLGGAARQAGFDVRLIDCSPMKLGWKSLAREIQNDKPDVIGIGENHALYSHEALKALKLAKEANPDCVTIAGGSHFTNLIEETLVNDYIDFIALREGEETFVELLRRIEGGETDYSGVRGIAYRDNGSVRITPPRPLIDDLDSLPMPAYDLMPMHLYGTSKYLFSPGGCTIHHSRGCVSNCRFCAWWLQMAETSEENGKLVHKPRWRTKSVARTIEEIRLLVEKFNKRCLVFVDEFWNRDPEWSSEFADALIAANLGVEWFAFMRADAIIRDEEQGILEKLVRSGLVHVSVGVERVEKDELKKMGKGFYSEDRTVECFHVLRDKYPGVFRQGTFIVGVRNETRDTILAQADFARKLDLDYPGFHPITPVPGTAFWDEATKNKWIEVTDFSEYDWMTPIISSEFLTREEIEDLLITLSKRFVSIGWFLRGITGRTSYKRKMYVWWLIVTIRVVWDSIKSFMPIKTKTYSGLVKPEWYDD
ncbi:B12-binding domain-containing radical SAM protein [bacterium]